MEVSDKSWPEVCVCVCVDLIVNHMQCCGENVDRRRSVPRVRVPSLRRKTQGQNNQRAAVRLRWNLREVLKESVAVGWPRRRRRSGVGVKVSSV